MHIYIRTDSKGPHTEEAISIYR